MTAPNAPSERPLPPLLQEPGETRYDMFALAPEGRGGWPIDPRRAREFEDRGHRLFSRAVTTSDWGEVTTHVDGRRQDDGYDLLSDDGMDPPSPEAVAEAEAIRRRLRRHVAPSPCPCPPYSCECGEPS